MLDPSQTGNMGSMPGKTSELTQKSCQVSVPMPSADAAWDTWSQQREFCAASRCQLLETGLLASDPDESDEGESYGQSTDKSCHTDRNV